MTFRRLLGARCASRSCRESPARSSRRSFRRLDKVADSVKAAVVAVAEGAAEQCRYSAADEHEDVGRFGGRHCRRTPVTPRIHCGGLAGTGDPDGVSTRRTFANGDARAGDGELAAASGAAGSRPASLAGRAEWSAASEPARAYACVEYARTFALSSPADCMLSFAGGRYAMGALRGRPRARDAGTRRRRKRGRRATRAVRPQSLAAEPASSHGAPVARLSFRRSSSTRSCSRA